MNASAAAQAARLQAQARTARRDLVRLEQAAIALHAAERAPMHRLSARREPCADCWTRAALVINALHRDTPGPLPLIAAAPPEPVEIDASVFRTLETARPDAVYLGWTVVEWIVRMGSQDHTVIRSQDDQHYAAPVAAWVAAQLSDGRVDCVPVAVHLEQVLRQVYVPAGASVAGAQSTPGSGS